MWRSLGKLTVTTSGTLVRVTVNESDPAKSFQVHSLLFQAWPTNTGKIWIFSDPNGNKATGAFILAILAAPGTNVVPAASATITDAQNALNAADYYVDADVNGESCIASYLLW